MITIHDQVTEAERELAMRRRVYPRLVSSGKMKAHDGEVRIALMQAILDTLKAKQKEEMLL
jgi:hypothetical protein